MLSNVAKRKRKMAAITRDSLMGAETRLVCLHQPHLADGRGSLQFVQLARASLPAQPLHPLGDSTGRHQQYLTTLACQLCDLLGPLRHCCVV